MRTIIEGHRYQLANFEYPETCQTIQFIHKEPHEDNQGSLNTVSDGTTNEEVLAMLINRMNYLQSKSPCRENTLVITKLEESLMWLEKRTNDRIKRNVEGKNIV